MEPVLKYAGGKRRELGNIGQYVPGGYTRYVEPFFGGGALYFHLEARYALVNDINGDLMNFYRDLRGRGCTGI